MNNDWNFDLAKKRILNQRVNDIRSSLNNMILLYSDFTNIPEDHLPLLKKEYLEINHNLKCILLESSRNEEERTFYNQA